MASDGETSCANDPNFAAIYSFLKVFGRLHGLELPTINKLQEFIENTEEVSDALKELHLKLLRRALKSAHSDRWEKCLIKFCHQQGHHQEAWEIERFSYKKASTQVKLKVLKFLLEYQFTCHPKFKSAINAIPSKELRLDPIGRDKNGCVYWLQVDSDANLCLYKEDQDEETWQLIARNREELVKVISQLKSGEEITPSSTCTENEVSSETEENPPPEKLPKPEVEEDNEEEFLSPESESENEETGTVQNQKTEESTPKEPNKAETVDNTADNNVVVTEEIPKEIQKNETEILQEEKVKPILPNTEIESKSIVNEYSKDSASCQLHESTAIVSKDSNELEELNKEDTKNESKECNNVSIEDNINANIEDKLQENTLSDKNLNNDSNNDKTIENIDTKSENKEEETETAQETKEVDDVEHEKLQINNTDLKENEGVSEAIEDPLLVVTGDGNGADCDSFFLGEEISEDVMYFYGEGCGYDNDAGNPEAVPENNEAKSEDENDNKELVIDGKDLVNGEHDAISTKLGNVKLKPVGKRSLKKQSNDSNDANPDMKKPCMREEISNSSKVEMDLKGDKNVNDKNTTDSESTRKSIEVSDNTSPKKNNVKKRRCKVKKKVVARKIKDSSVKKPINNSVSETDNGQDKTNIIEKRKSSVSSVDEDLADVSKTGKEDPLAVEEPLPPKKLRLETTPEGDDDAPHSKDVSEPASDGKEATSDDASETKDLNDSISKRKKIKAHKGKFKRKQKIKDPEKNDKSNDRSKKNCKSLKRSLVEATMSDKNKSESQSDSEDDEPVASGKRLKIKPKKIITSTRKKVEAKLLQKQSSDESEEETLYSLAGKKFASKKLIKKKKSKSKNSKDSKDKQSKPDSDDSDTPVRQSRRIAQQKIKEEAERRHLEEVALRELKLIHKKKGKDDDDEEEWQASGRGSSSEEDRKRKHKKTWRASDSTGPEPDSDSDSPLFDLQPELEPEPDYDKSDHEFSPESDIETEEPAEPLKRARTLQEEKDDGFCKQCGSGEQPEWILLCDKCDSGYHASCLKPLLFYIPQGDWFCPPCNHEKLIQSLESELVKLDELAVIVEDERARKKLEEPEPVPEKAKEEKKESDDDSEGSSCSSWSSVSSSGVYRLRARKQLPVSLRAQEYDRLISAAIKEEYVEPTTSAGNQGRGKDISTIIEAAEEEKMKAERDAIEQGMPVSESKKSRKKQRKKPRKLNSLDIPSEDDDEVDEDFKDTGGASSSEDISSSADKDSGDSRSSDSLPIRRTTGRSETKKDRPKMTESSPETKKKKKGVFEDSSSESTGAKEWATASKPKPKSSHHHHHRSRDPSKKRDKSKKSRRSRGLTQYDADGNVIRARVTYGGLSGEEGENDWSPKHRTRQKKINYTETPNTESEDEMHKSSGKHMPDSSDEFKVTESSDSDWDADQKKKDEHNAERMKAINDLVKKTAVVPLEKLPEDVTRAKTEELQAHLDAQAANAASRPLRGKGSRGGRGSRGPRGRGGRGGGSNRSGSPQTDDALAKLVGVKVKELGQDGSPTKPNQVEREKKRQEREAKQAEKEAKRQERLQKKEEKEKLKEQKAKEREEKKLAKIALQESKRIKKEKEYAGPMVGYGPPGGMGGEMFQPRPPVPYHDQRFPNAPRLQVRAELRGMLAGDDRGSHSQQQHNALREGTLSVAGSPQPFKPVSEEPSIITRMPHNMINQQYRGPMMYPNNAGYGPRGPQNMYQLHPGLGGGPGGPGGPGARQYPPQYYRLPPYGPARPDRPPHQPYRHHMQGPPGPSPSMHHPGPPGSMHHQPGFGYRGPPPNSMPQGLPDRPGASPNPPSHLGIAHMPGPPNSHGPSPSGPIGHQSGPSHLTPPGHLSGPPPHLNQLGRPPGLPNTLNPTHEPPNTLGGVHPHGSPSHGPPNHGGSPGPHRLPNPLMGPPNSHGPPNPHGGPPNSHGGPQNLHSGPQNLQSGPQNLHSGPQNLQSGPQNLHSGQNHLGARNQLDGGNPGSSPMGRESSPAPGTSGVKHGAPGTGPSPHDEPPIKIKAEVKTEPEYRSPPTSPGESVGVGSRPDETPRHPKIKHTENKDRRPRFPLGPYAPHYAPYGPYAPPHYAPEAHHTLQQYLSAERARSPGPGGEGAPRGYLPAHMRPYGVPRAPPHALHPMPNQSAPRDAPPTPPGLPPRPPSPLRAPRPAHPHLPAAGGAPPPASHPLPHPPPSYRLQAHLRMPSQPTPLVAHHQPSFPPQAHSQPPPALAAGKPMQAHLASARSPLRSPGPPRRQSLTPPQNPPLHQPYAQQTQMPPAPAMPSRPTPPPALAPSPSPLGAHLMSQPLHPPRCTPPPHLPAARTTPPNLAHHLPPQHERASPNVPISYQYADRRPLLPQPIPRDSLPPRSPPRREFDPDAEPRDFESPESPKETAQRAEADSTIAIKTEPMLGAVKEEPNREEGGVFGGLVSYFSSQHEDDIDA